MKKIIVWLLAIVLIMTNLVAVVNASNIDADGILDTAGKYITDKYNTTKGQIVNKFILQNENYIFIAVGSTVRAKDVIHIYKKPAADELGYEYLTSIKQASTRADMELPVKNMWIHNDTLYVKWNYAKASWVATTGYPTSGGIGEPLYSYDISDIEKGATLVPTTVTNGTDLRNAAFHPYNRGGTSYVDYDNGVVMYQTSYTGTRSGDTMTSCSMSYRVYDISGTIPILKKTLTNGSLNAVHIYIKDNFLYEILQNNNGMDMTDSSSNMVGNNKVNVYNLSEAIIGKGDTVDIRTALVASYTTAFAGDRVINDAKVIGDHLYLATTKGLELVDISGVATATPQNPLILARTTLLHTDEKVNVLKVYNEKLFLGTNGALCVYNIATGSAELTDAYAYTSGVADLDFNASENLIYILSAANSGGMTVIDADVLSSSLDVSNIVMTKESNTITNLENGNIEVNANVLNNNSNAVPFKSMFALYEDGMLTQISIKDWVTASGENVTVNDTITVTNAENAVLRFMLLSNDKSRPLYMHIAGETVLKKDFGSTVLSTGTSNENIYVSEIDNDGKMTISGTLSQYIGKPVYIFAENTEAQADDRLSKIRYIDVISSSESGKYSFNLIPSDSGEYKINLSNPVAKGNISHTTDVPDAKIEIQNSIEIPGVDAFIAAKISKGQNVQKIELEMTFDEHITVLEGVEASDSFIVDDVVVENGVINVDLSKKSQIDAQTQEFCVIPIRVNDSATIGDHSITVSANLYDKYQTALAVTTVNGILKIESSTPKYEAINDAIEALKILKNADEITVEEYLDEKPKVEDARNKVDIAKNTYLARDSQLGETLIENLELSESKLLEIKPYYDAVATLNAESLASVISTFKANKTYFGVEDDVLNFYDSLTDKSKIDQAIEATTFVKPSDVYKTFYEALVLNSTKELKWQKIEELFVYAERAKVLDLTEYNALTNEEQKIYVRQQIDYVEFLDIPALQGAIDTAVVNAPAPGQDYNAPSGVGSIKDSISITSGEEKTKPEEVVVFKDISAYDWAKEAIMYLYDNNVISGKANDVFAPGDNVKREEFAKMIAIAFDIESKPSTVSFVDVAENAWYGEYVYALASNGIINGKDNNSFGVGENITREDVAVILDRVIKFKGIIPTIKNDLIEFADKENISEYAVSSVNNMYIYGAMTGYSDRTVGPKLSAGRAETAQLIYKILMINNK